MKRYIVLSVATVTLAIPATTAGAATRGAPSPAEYRPECEQGYQSAKAFWDAVLPPGKAIFGPAEKGICGEQKNTPS